MCAFGPNIGLNLIALHTLLPEAKLTGVEVNERAAKKLAELGYVMVRQELFYDVPLTKQYDLVIAGGVLIHQDLSMLNEAYDILYCSSKRYILTCDYYNATPVEVEYYGNHLVLFKRDFAVN